MPGFPSTLPGFGAAAAESGRTAATMPAVTGARDSSFEAAASGKVSSGGSGVVALPVRPEVSSANAEDAIVSSEDETPIIVDPTAFEQPFFPVSTDPPTILAAALPIGPENRSASGEIIVRPLKAKSQHSPAAEVRLAHLREETSRSFIRPSQSVTPPGSARALDEPPPLLDGPAPEPPVRSTTQLVRATAVEAAVDGAAAIDVEEAGSSRRRGWLITAAVAIVVAGGGVLWLASRHPADNESAAAPSASQATAPAAPPPVTLPTSTPTNPPKPAAHAAATPPALDEAEERTADPKLARARAAEAGPLLIACRTSYQEARMKDAEAICTAARDANPLSAEANGYLAHALLNRNRRRESLAAAERAVKLNPRWADAYVVIGGIHQDAGEMADARRAYQRYLELEPHGQFAPELRAIVDRLGKL
jgi:hypothetical protein